MTITPTATTELLQDVDLSTPEGCDHAMQLMTRTTFEVYCRIAYAFIHKHKHGTREEFCERYGKSKRTLQKYEKRMRELRLITSEPPRGIHAIRAEKGASVENDVIDAEVTIVPAEEKATGKSIKDRLKSKPKTYPSNANVRPHQPARQPGRLVQHQPDHQCGVLAPGELTIPEHVQDRDAFSAGQKIIESLSLIYEECERWQKQGRIPAQQWSSIRGYCDYIHASASCGGTKSTKSELNTVDVAWSADDGDEIRTQSNG